jgi:predicted transcriptional regulator
MLFTLTLAGYKPEDIISNPLLREMNEALSSKWPVLKRVRLLVKVAPSQVIVTNELGKWISRRIVARDPEKLEVEEVLRSALPRISASRRLEIIR